MTTNNKTNDILEQIRQQYESNKPKEKKQKFSEEERKDFLKRYYNVIEEGDHQFRVLPPKDGSTPFVETYFHQLKVNGKWPKLYCPKKNDGTKCPLCEAEDALKTTGDQDDFKLSRTYQASLFYIVKGMDRNKIDDGVKYWRFKHNYQNAGVFDKIVPIVGRKGEIWDPINGRDLLITAGKTTGPNGNTYVAVTTVMYDDESRLVEDDDTLKSLVEDTTTWKDVYKSKTVEYLQQVVEGKAPYWDESTRKMVTPQGHTKKIVSVEVDSSTEETIPEPHTVDKRVTQKVDEVFDTPSVSTGNGSSSEKEEEVDDLPF